VILNDDLSESVRGLYEVFERYRFRRNMPRDDVSGMPEEIALLRSKPLRELAADELAPYAGKAITTWGDVEDFKHFLPRLMELIATEGSVGFRDPEVVFSRFRYGKWEGWERGERRAVESYLLSLWRFVLSRYPTIHGWEESFRSLEDSIRGVSSMANDVLAAIAQATDDLSPYLRIWREDRSLSALRHLADFVVDALAAVISDGTLGPWWKDRPAQAQVKAWLSEPATWQRLEEGINARTSRPFATSAYEALDLLARFRTRLKE
jgi:hypothetical protein